MLPQEGGRLGRKGICGGRLSFKGFVGAGKGTVEYKGCGEREGKGRWLTKPKNIVNGRYDDQPEVWVGWSTECIGSIVNGRYGWDGHGKVWVGWRNMTCCCISRLSRLRSGYPFSAKTCLDATSRTRPGGASSWYNILRVLCCGA